MEITFPEVDSGSQALAIQPALESPINKGMAAIAATSETRKTLACKDLLKGDTLASAEREATKLLPEMLANTEVFTAYGTSALVGVNDLINRLLHEVEPEKIPELTQIMQDLNKDMRGIRRKYDVSDPKIREKYEKWKGGVARFFGNARSLVEFLMEDIQSLEKQLDKVTTTLEGRQYTLSRNVVYYDELYDQNEIEIGNLIYVIGVMELIRDQAAENAAHIVVGDAQLGDRGGEQKASLAEFVNNMDIRTSEFKGRLFIAWSTAPQVRTMRTLNISLAARINTLLTITIPTMKATILHWRMLMQTADAAKLSQEVINASNEWLQSYSAAGAQLVPTIAQAINQPTLSIQTVEAMANSIQQQADGIISAVQEGAQRRAELEDAMVKAQKVMSDATAKLGDTLVDEIISRNTKPLEIETSVT